MALVSARRGQASVGTRFVGANMARCWTCGWSRDDTQVAREGMRTLAREHAELYGHLTEVSAIRGIRYDGRDGG